jgi:exportin-T
MDQQRRALHVRCCHPAFLCNLIGSILVLRNKFSHTLTLFFLCTYVDQWTTFFTDFFTLMHPADSPSPTTFNRHLSLLFFHLVLEISGEVADQVIKSARQFNPVRHERDGRVRDAVRQRDAAQINRAVLAIVERGSERMAVLRGSSDPSDCAPEVDEVIEVVDCGIRTFASYVGTHVAGIESQHSIDVSCRLD